MGADFLGDEQGGIGFPELGEDLRGSGSGGHALQVGYGSNDNAHREGFGSVPPQGGPQADRETTSERTGRRMGVSPAGGSNGGRGIAGGVDIRLPPTEHSFTVHCNKAHYGLVSGSSAEAGVKGGQSVVVAGQNGCGGDADGGLGGGTDGGGEETNRVETDTD